MDPELVEKILFVEENKEAEDLRLERIEKQKLLCQKELREKTRKMLSKDCPLRGSRCSKACVHFAEGKLETVRSPRSGIDLRVYTASPYCRLWTE